MTRLRRVIVFLHSEGGFCIFPAPKSRSPHAYHTTPAKEKGDGYEMRGCTEPVLQNSLPYIQSWLVCPGQRFCLTTCCAGWQFSLVFFLEITSVSTLCNRDSKLPCWLLSHSESTKHIYFQNIVCCIYFMGPTVWCLRKRSFYISAPKIWGVESTFFK